MHAALYCPIMPQKIFTIGKVILGFGIGITGLANFNAFGMQLYAFDQSSMLPTLAKSGEFILVNKFSYKVLKEHYKIGDVVVSAGYYGKVKGCKQPTAKIIAVSIVYNTNLFIKVYASE